MVSSVNLWKHGAICEAELPLFMILSNACGAEFPALRRSLRGLVWTSGAAQVTAWQRDTHPDLIKPPSG